MKKLFLIYIALFCYFFAGAQILAPMGSGLPAAPDKISTYKEGVAVVYTDKNLEIGVQYWNGDFWNEIPSPISSALVQQQVLDLIAHNDVLYLAYSYLNAAGETVNAVSTWDHNNWKNISNKVITKSFSLNKLLVEDNTLKCFGKFVANNQRYNILKLENNVWIPEGNVITENIENDVFKSINFEGDKVIATGSFSNPINNFATLAEWDGNQWKTYENPPFLGENITLGTYNQNIVVYGKSKFNSQSVNMKISGNWRDISAGLENYAVNDIKQFAQIGGDLFAVGEFVDNTTNKVSNLMIFDGKAWAETYLNLSDIQQVYSLENTVLVSGDFSDNSQINNIGVIYNDRAQITARVFEDLNNNCKKDENEQWMSNYPMQLEGLNTTFYTDFDGQLYLPVYKNEYALNASEYQHYTPTCPDIELNVDQHKTYYGAALGVRQELNIYDAEVKISDINSYSSLTNDYKTAVLCVNNIGSKFISNGQIVLEIGAGISNFTSEVPYTKRESNTIYWDLNVDAHKSTCFKVSYQITDVDASDIIANVHLQEGNTDKDPSNNKSVVKYKTGSQPSNYKHCANGKIIKPETDVMTYKIGFTNETVFTATSVKVVDLLDDELIISSKGLAYLSSHNSSARTRVRLILTEENTYKHKIITSFRNINLPPKTTNETECNGFVDYDIHILPVKLGDVICNSAKIYFSNENGLFNEPIPTNEVCSEVSETLSSEDNTSTGNLNEHVLEKLKISPNPVSDRLYFENESQNTYAISIVSSIGNEVITAEIKKFQNQEIKVSDLAAGVYFIYSNGVFVKKFVIN